VDMQRGIVRQYDSIKGRGVIETERGERFPVRYSAIQGEGVRTLKCGDAVVFEVESGATSNAVHVKRA
jgi:cold shock CspA family protein